MVISGVVRNTTALAKTLRCQLVTSYRNTASLSTPILGPIHSLRIHPRSKMNWGLEGDSSDMEGNGCPFCESFHNGSRLLKDWVVTRSKFKDAAK